MYTYYVLHIYNFFTCNFTSYFLLSPLTLKNSRLRYGHAAIVKISFERFSQRFYKIKIGPFQNQTI